MNKEHLFSEIKEASITVGYLAASLTILETYKSLILLQQGIHEVRENYIFALVEVLALGKVVALAQNLPFLKAFNRYSVAAGILYQSVVMTIIIDLVGRLEDMLFPGSVKFLSQSGSPLVLTITHQFVAMLIFLFLFTIKAIDQAMGKGKLWGLLFSPTSEKIGPISNL